MRFYYFLFYLSYTVSLLAPNQLFALDCDKPEILSFESSKILVMKINDEKIEDGISKQTDDKNDIKITKAFKNKFDSFKLQECYLTEPIPVLFQIDSDQNKISVFASSSPGSSSFSPNTNDNYNYHDIEISDSAKFKEIKLSEISDKILSIKSFSKGNTINGFAQFTIVNFRKSKQNLILPTIENSSERDGKIISDLKHISLQTDKNKSFFENRFEVEKYIDKKEDEKTYERKLAYSANASDFEIKGVDVSKSYEELKNIINKNNWFIEEQKMPPGKKSIHVCSTECNKPVQDRPQNYFDFWVAFETVENQLIMKSIRFNGSYSYSAEELQSMLLSKYGYPLWKKYDGMHRYYYGIVDKNKPHNSTGNNIMELNIRQYNKPTSRGETFVIFLTIINAKASDQNSKNKIIKQTL